MDAVVTRRPLAVVVDKEAGGEEDDVGRFRKALERAAQEPVALRALGQALVEVELDRDVVAGQSRFRLDVERAELEPRQHLGERRALEPEAAQAREHEARVDDRGLAESLSGKRHELTIESLDEK